RTRILGCEVDRAAGHSDRNHQIYRDGNRQVRAQRRIQALRSPGVAAHDCRMKLLRYALILVVCAAGCRATQTPAAEKKPTAPLQVLQIKHPGTEKVFVGTQIEATSEGLPPGRKVDLIWKTVNGGWVIADYFHFRGKKFTETVRSLGRAETDDNGRL